MTRLEAARHLASITAQRGAELSQEELQALAMAIRALGREPL